MNKKVRIIVSLLVLTLLLVAGYNTFLSPKATEGSKEVSIQVINEKENEDKTFTYKTDGEFLLGLLEENKDELGASFEKFDFGTMVTGMMNYLADDKSEYFHITVNGEDAVTGPGEIPLNDKDKYVFELRNF